MEENNRSKIIPGKISIPTGWRRNYRENKIAKSTIVVLYVQVLLFISIAMEPLFMIDGVYFLNKGWKKKNRQQKNRKERFCFLQHNTNVQFFTRKTTWGGMRGVC